jgi:PKD repeat protein
VLSAQTQRMVFYEEFTQASCAPCAAANPAYNALLASNTAKANSIKYQTSWPGVDPMNTQTAAEVANRVSYYAVTGVPDAIQDGSDYSSPGNITQSTIDAEYAVASPFSMVLTHWFNAANDSIFINCDITCTQAVTLSTPRVRIAMIEKTITFSSAPGTNGETVFYNVMRKMYPDANGTMVSTGWTVGQKKTLSFKAAIPSYVYNKTQIGTIAWIQDDATKAVQQSVMNGTASTPSISPPLADFTSDVNTSCDGVINFKDLSALFPTSWQWDFGDGTTSNLQNPVHQYLTSGTYTVKLNAFNSHGSNLATRTSYITVTLSGSAPSGTNATRCGPGVVNLAASGTGTLGWYNSAGALVNTGNTYSPSLTGNGNMNFVVASITPNAVSTTGRMDSALGGGGFFTANTVHGLYFDVLQPCMLVSVVTYASTAGNRTIEVLDPSGVSIHSTVVNIPAGKSTVTLNFSVGVGTGYFLKVASGSTVGLYRNNANAAFPYTSGVINVTGTDVSSAYYYFFYDWQVQQNPCAGPGTIVKGIDSCFFAGVNNLATEQVLLNVFPNPGTGTFTASFNGTSGDHYKVSIVNTLGQIVYEEALGNFTGSWSKELSIAAYGKGIYMLIISNGRSAETKRIVVR